MGKCILQSRTPQKYNAYVYYQVEWRMINRTYIESLNPLKMLYIDWCGGIESISDYNFDFHSFSNDDIIIMSCLLYIRMYILYNTITSRQ